MTVYDQTRDREPFEFMLGLPVHCGRLAGCVQALLEDPDSLMVQALARVALQQFTAWRAETLPEPTTEPVSLHLLIDEVSR